MHATNSIIIIILAEMYENHVLDIPERDRERERDRDLERDTDREPDLQKIYQIYMKIDIYGQY